MLGRRGHSREMRRETVVERIWPPARSKYRQLAEVNDIIYHGRGDIALHGQHEQRCASALAVEGEVFRCELHEQHGGWAHSNREAKAIWQ